MSFYTKKWVVEPWGINFEIACCKAILEYHKKMFYKWFIKGYER